MSEAVKRQVVGVVGGVVFAVAVALGGDARLANERVVISGEKEAWAASMSFQPRWIQLVPDGKSVLYPGRARMSGCTSEEVAAVPPVELFLRDLASLEDRAIPLRGLGRGGADEALSVLGMLGAPIVSGDARTILAFTPTTLPNEPGLRQVVILDTTTGQETRTKVIDWRVSPMFAGDGKTILVNGQRDDNTARVWVLYAPHGEPRKLPRMGSIIAVCPTDNWLAMAEVKRGKAPPGVTEPREIKLFLCDYKLEKQGAELPLKGQCMGSCWSADGRYFCYTDWHPSGEESPVETRLWSVKDGKEAGSLKDVEVLGPGPGGTVVLTRSGDKKSGESDEQCHFLLLDPASGAKAELAIAPAAPIYAGQGKVIYARKGLTGKSVVYIADVKVPAAQTQTTTVP